MYTTTSKRKSIYSGFMKELLVTEILQATYCCKWNKLDKNSTGFRKKETRIFTLTDMKEDLNISIVII